MGVVIFNFTAKGIKMRDQEKKKIKRQTTKSLYKTGTAATNQRQSLPSSFLAIGFSLTEILVTLTIVGTLALVAGSIYSKARDAPFKAGQKLELSELSKALHFARQVDGGYHQKIFTMGYRPSKFLLAGVGFRYLDTDAICCTSQGFPQNAQEALTKSSEFFTLNKDIYDSSKAESSVKNHQICDRSQLCTYKVQAQNMHYFTGGVGFSSAAAIGDSECNIFKVRGTAHCTCNTFVLSSRIPVRHRLIRASIRAYMNEEGFFCRQDVGRLGGDGTYKLY